MMKNKSDKNIKKVQIGFIIAFITFCGLTGLSFVLFGISPDRTFLERYITAVSITGIVVTIIGYWIYHASYIDTTSPFFEYTASQNKIRENLEKAERKKPLNSLAEQKRKEFISSGKKQRKKIAKIQTIKGLIVLFFFIACMVGVITRLVYLEHTSVQKFSDMLLWCFFFGMFATVIVYVVE